MSVGRCAIGVVSINPRNNSVRGDWFNSFCLLDNFFLEGDETDAGGFGVLNDGELETGLVVRRGWTMGGSTELERALHVQNDRSVARDTCDKAITNSGS